MDQVVKGLEYGSYISTLFESILFKDIVKRYNIRYPKKLYDLAIFKITPDTGRVMENAAAIELIRRGMDIYYYKTGDGKEVDIVVEEGLKIEQLIQVCYYIDNHLTKTREIRGLIKASEESGCNNLMVLTWDHEGEERVGTRIISYVPMWKWLIQAGG